MIDLKCDHCGENYKLKNVRVDEHWNDSWSFEPVFCHCPHCDSILKKVQPDAVDLAKNLTGKNIIAVGLFFGLWLLGLLTDTLTYISPVTIGIFGIYLVKNAKLKDHKIIGWLLITLSIFLLAWLNTNA